MKFEWEKISGKDNSQNKTFRSKVVGGWIVKIMFIDEDFGVGVSSIFIPDHNHEWNVKDE